MRQYSYLLVVIFILSGNDIFAQRQNDFIEVKKGFGTTFIQNDKKLAPKELLEITKVNPEAYEEMRIAKRNYDWGTAFGYAGGFLVGWPLGTAIAGGDANWTLAGIGAGLLVASIPFHTSFSKHAREAVGIYNSGLSQKKSRKVDWDLAFTSNGIGFKMKF